MTNHTDTSRSGELVAAMKDQLESWEFEDPRETWWKWQHQYAQATDCIEALEAENERLRFHLDTALEALIMEGVCDGECGACKAARAALGEGA